MKKNNKGFTLTELIVVIVIIAILAAVLIPTLTGTVNKSRKSAASQEAASVNTTYQAWLIDTVADGGYDEKTDTTAVLRLASFAKYYANASEKALADIAYTGTSDMIATVDGISILYVGDPDAKTFTVQTTNKYYVKVTSSGETTYDVADSTHLADLGSAASTIDTTKNDVFVNLDAVAISGTGTQDVTILGRTSLIATVSSSATGVATVSTISGGKFTITGVAAGTATISLKNASDPVQTLITITVTITA